MIIPLVSQYFAKALFKNFESELLSRRSHSGWLLEEQREMFARDVFATVAPHTGLVYEVNNADYLLGTKWHTQCRVFRLSNL